MPHFVSEYGGSSAITECLCDPVRETRDRAHDPNIRYAYHSAIEILTRKQVFDINVLIEGFSGQP
jgi:hypothetical protein